MKDSNFLEPDPLRPPSVFSARWFRLLLVLLFLLIVAVVGLPYLLEWTAPISKPAPPLVLTPPVQPVPPPAAQTQPETPAPPAPPEKAEKPAAPPAEKAPAAREKPGYAVQVGAFQNAANAKRLASLLRKEKFPVQQLTVSRPDRSFQVIASGASGSAVSEKMKKLGLDGVLEGTAFTINRGMTLKDAVTLSERLKEEGLDVKVKTLQKTVKYHLVWVGSFSDMKGAENARKDLEAKGISGHVVVASSR